MALIVVLDRCLQLRDSPESAPITLLPGDSGLELDSSSEAAEDSELITEDDAITNAVAPFYNSAHDAPPIILLYLLDSKEVIIRK
jgi:hypothetical protein